jgi:glycosyltransferase A (GT-A) superfamily protein (DUF2064 family)
MTNFLVLAKTPVPGRVKTRLCPPWTPTQAAELAGAALADTLDTVGRGTLVIDGDYPAPPGWRRIAQRGDQLPSRLANAFVDAGSGPSVLIGMDTPQVTGDLLADAARRLVIADAVLGLAEDGGWWALGLRDPLHAEVLRRIATSTSETGAETFAALRRRGLQVTLLRTLRDVDTATDALAVAAQCPPRSRFTRAVARLAVEVPA